MLVLVFKKKARPRLPTRYSHLIEANVACVDTDEEGTRFVKKNYDFSSPAPPNGKGQPVNSGVNAMPFDRLVQASLTTLQPTGAM